MGRSLHEWIVTGAISENIAKQRGYRELVRCKDCKHNSVGNWCNAHMEHYPDDDWFCADGEQ